GESALRRARTGVDGARARRRALRGAAPTDSGAIDGRRATAPRESLARQARPPRAVGRRSLATPRHPGARTPRRPRLARATPPSPHRRRVTPHDRCERGAEAIEMMQLREA